MDAFLRRNLSAHFFQTRLVYLLGVESLALETFHQKLLGKDLEKTPEGFRLTERHKALYKAFEKGKRGYVLPQKVTTREDFESFLATFVVAVYQTTLPTPEHVTVAVAKLVDQWALAQIKLIARHIFSLRKGASKADIEVLRSALHRISLGSSVLQIPEEPPRWVAYGYTAQDVLPPWMRGRLV